MLVPGSNHITFDVNVTGTSSVPTVRCVLGGDVAYMFTARNTGGTTWEADILVPAELTTQVPFKIEVQVNGRIFTPINRVFDISAPTAAVSNVEIQGAAVPVDQPPYEPVQETAEEPLIVLPTPIAQSLMKSLAEVKVQTPSKRIDAPVPLAKTTSKLQEMANKPRPVKPRIGKAVSTSLADIAALHEVANPNQKGAAPTAAVQSGIPVTLKKGEVKYL